MAEEVTPPIVQQIIHITHTGFLVTYLHQCIAHTFLLGVEISGFDPLFELLAAKDT